MSGLRPGRALQSPRASARKEEKQAMFRRKDAEVGRHGSPAEAAPEPAYPRVATEPKAQPPELPRRALETPPTALGATDRGPAADPQVPEKKRLIVGDGISLSGEITACDRLVVQGSVQVTLNQTRAIEITETGKFTNGKAEVEEAEISGVYEGELTVRKRLLIRSTGQVKGTVRYGELEIERGGKLSGSVSMLSEGQPEGRSRPAGQASSAAASAPAQQPA
jgi:cytoskeletal protein CcmA (bactofilin family)